MNRKFGLLLAAATFATANAQVGNEPQHFKPVILNVTATDHAGHPVTDLEPGDLRVFDDGAQQQITSLRLDSSNPYTVLVILLDLLDLNFQQAGYEAEQLRKTFAGLTTSGALYLYVLLANGNLYPIHALPVDNAPLPTAEDAPWIEQAGSLLNQALQKANQAQSIEFIAHPEEHFRATFSALESLEQGMSRLHGRKQLLWITDGIPSIVRLAGRGSVNLGPSLRRLAAQFTAKNIAIYTLESSLAPDALSREGMDILSQTTGGRTFINSDLKTALQQAGMDTSASYLLAYGAPLAQNSDGRFHKVRITCNRKGVRLLKPEAYLAEVEPVQAAALAAPAPVPAALSHAVPLDLGHTFAGVVHLVESRSMVIQLEDTRFIVVDFNGAQFSPQTGDRVKVRVGEYDGHGLVAEAVSIVQPATPANAAPPPQPANSEADRDPVLKQARETEATMDRALPNFLCREVVKRYENAARQKQWKLQDTLSAEVLYSRKAGETYRDVRVNGRPTHKPWPELGGDISTGEFGSLLHSLLTKQGAQFQFMKEDSVNGVPGREYSFRINRAQSDWKILSDYQYIVPQYHGRVWFDRDGNRVLRIERTAEGIPSAFPLNSVEAEVNFGEIRLESSRTYSLPTQAETRVCIRDRHECSRKTIAFRDYKQFTGESKITF